MRFTKSIAIVFLVLVAFSACKKNPDPYSVTPNFLFVNGDTTYFDNNVLLFSSSDTLTFNIVISSTYLVSSNALVKVGVTDSYRSTYNSEFGTTYQQMPGNAYSFQDTITASPSSSSIYDTIPVKIFKHALTGDQNFMLPIQILSAGGNSIDPDYSVIYLHTINNTLSGVYNSNDIKTMYVGSASDSNVSSTDTFSLVKNLVPQTNNLSLLDYADLGSNGWQYILSFGIDGNGFSVAPNEVILNSVESGSFKILESSFDAETKNIYIKSSYKNSEGNERIVEETLTLQ